MSLPDRHVRSRCTALAFLGVVATVFTGCATSRSAAPYESEVRVEPVSGTAQPTTDAATAAALPTLPVIRGSALPGGQGPGRQIQRLEVSDADLRTVVQGLADQFGLDYHIGPEVEGRVSARLHGVSLDSALAALVTPHGYAYELQDSVLRVTATRLKSRIFSLDYMSITRAGVGTTIVQRRLGAAGTVGGLGAQMPGGGMTGAVGGAGDLIQSVQVTDLWEEIRTALEGLVFDQADAARAADPPEGGGGIGATAPGAFSRVEADGRRLLVNPISGTVVVTASPEKLAEVAALLGAIEGSVQRQVLIEAKIVEVSLNRRFQFGIDWGIVGRLGGVDIRAGADQGGLSFSLRRREAAGGIGREVDLVLRALGEQGDVRVLSSPRVSVLNNQRAVINVATDEVFFSIRRQPVFGPTGATIGFTTEIEPQQIAVGIVLDVFPQIGSNNTITMSVRPVITNLVRVEAIRLEDGTQATAPVIDRRETDTVVRARGGETIMIGGLMQNRRTESDAGIPILRDIPLLGRLFTSTRRETEKRELIIFLTPTIVAGQPPTVD